MSKTARAIADLAPVHGGTDSLPDPRYDFSSNANAMGPCPSVLAAVRRADLSCYPDPLYAGLRETLARFHQTTPDRIIVGAGASELIVRLIRRFDGPVNQLAPTFSEYARGAGIAGRRLVTADTPAAFLRRARRAGVGFICVPNNPTGDVWPLDFIRAAAECGPLVVDLAYAPLCDASLHTAVEDAAASAYRLYSPNKAFGLTGIRAAYVIAPRPDETLRHLASSWVIGQDAVKFLAAGCAPAARAWLKGTLPRLQHWRGQQAGALTALGLTVREGPATFLLAQVASATSLALALRARGVRVRDCTSFGLPQWIRVSAQPPAARRALLTAIKNIL
jgi:histidinol-phosphate aminotransferase